MSRDPISDATSTILTPSLEVQGFKRLTNRITARIVDDVLQFVSVQVSRRGTQRFHLGYASICLFRPRDMLPLQPGGLILGSAAPRTWLQRLLRLGSEQRGFDGTEPDLAHASMTEAVGLVSTLALPFFAQTRTTPLLYERLLQERWGSQHHLLFEMGCCLTRLKRFIEAERVLKRAVLLYEKDGRDWCRREIERISSLSTAIQQGRSDERLIEWTQESVATLALDSLCTGNLEPPVVGAERAAADPS